MRIPSLLLLAFLLGSPVLCAQSLTYPIVDTHQERCYNNSSAINAPLRGQPFFGQDAQLAGIQPSYVLSADTLTVFDHASGLTWQHGADTNGDGLVTSADKLNYTEAVARPAALNAASYGGYSDWRLPTIKELYSLIDFRGTDPNPTATDTRGLVPFLDRAFFLFSYGDLTANERIIDAQYATATLYTSTTMGGAETMFGVNFADGRIKGYPKSAGPGGRTMRYFVLCVRGNTRYGRNDLLPMPDSTVLDRATGLMWAQGDYGVFLNWQDALAWVQTMNGRKYLGHDDWRLPNVKELQSIVDYTRSPDYSGSAAIDPVFTCTRITNEAGQTDWPSYWSSTTHASANGGGATGAYVAFGRGMGYMNGAWIDVHGAGCQRSDPKAGDPAQYPQGRGPQGDAIRIFNAVRLVRDADTQTGFENGEDHDASFESATLEPTYPNPSTGTAVIVYRIPRGSHTTLRLTDVCGRHVATLVDGTSAAGTHSITYSVAGLTPGVYQYILTYNGTQLVRRVIVR